MHNPDTIFNYTIQMVRKTQDPHAIRHIDAFIAPTTNYISRMGMEVKGNSLGPHSLQRGAQIFHMLNLHMFKYSN